MGQFYLTINKGDATFTIAFDNDYIASLADNTQITLNYSGLITSDALSVDPATNKATLISGEGNKTESDTIKVYNAKITVNKVDDKEAPLAGAKFKLKNSDGLYYAGSGTNGTARHIQQNSRASKMVHILLKRVLYRLATIRQLMRQLQFLQIILQKPILTRPKQLRMRQVQYFLPLVASVPQSSTSSVQSL